MSNIEQLNLHITIENKTMFIDGKHIYNEIIVHMPRLHTFKDLDQPIDHLSKDDILQTFSNNIYHQVDLLMVYNDTSQSGISNNLSSNDNQVYSTVIEFPYLTSLNLIFVHYHYLEKFLNDKKTHLPCLVRLGVCYDKLIIVTKRFTNGRTRLNCMKVKELYIGYDINIDSEDFHSYFRSL
ncbi:unnamed protein product [Rotaria sordida]|uniref:Uncharacterized protein n=1 Tax=Rotaria sordida TaxID=392033 RepID=A0A818G3H5_9BILA|nr:unnamed protein product [Rotaria sordida]CAF3485340.1 unnamed protein product [Rotaria sordida]